MNKKRKKTKKLFFSLLFFFFAKKKARTTKVKKNLDKLSCLKNDNFVENWLCQNSKKFFKHLPSKKILNLKSFFLTCFYFAVYFSKNKQQNKTLWEILSGWQDSNLRHHAPKAYALPSCATSRLYVLWSFFKLFLNF
jgi:hypothetical protein